VEPDLLGISVRHALWKNYQRVGTGCIIIRLNFEMNQAIMTSLERIILEGGGG
jgi:hypothetical protein